MCAPNGFPKTEKLTEKLNKLALAYTLMLTLTLGLLSGCASSWNPKTRLFGDRENPTFGADRKFDFSKREPKEAEADIRQVNFLSTGEGEANAGAVWHTSYDVAEPIAAAANRPMLLMFTGSDWCTWCTKLKKDVFETPEFKSWAADNVVLVEVDFPRARKLPMDQRAKNEELKNKYDINAYPTVVLLDENGNEVGRLNYKSDPKVWISAANSMLK